MLSIFEEMKKEMDLLPLNAGHNNTVLLASPVNGFNSVTQKTYECRHTPFSNHRYAHWFWGESFSG